MQRASRGGWTPELVGRALAALRIAGALRDQARASASGRRQPSETPLEGVLRRAPVRARRRVRVGRGDDRVVRLADAPAGLADALRTLTVARYGRIEKFDSMADEAVQTAIRVTKQQQSAHSLLKEWASVVHRVAGRLAQEGLGLSGLRRPEA